MSRGFFVVLEGIDGAGTTTQAAWLAEYFRDKGHRVLLTHEPSNGPVGMLIRQVLAGRLQLPGGAGDISPRTLALLFAADRADHLQAQVLPALQEGAMVICDRYVLSSLAYQGLKLPVRWVETINSFALPADLTLVLDVGTAEASRRRARRGGSADLFEDDRLQELIAKKYRTLPHVCTFIDGWDELHGSKGPASWAANPWTWVITFKLLAPGAGLSCAGVGPEKRRSAHA